MRIEEFDRASTGRQIANRAQTQGEVVESLLDALPMRSSRPITTIVTLLAIDSIFRTREFSATCSMRSALAPCHVQTAAV
jgi:hypothetical protein